MRSSLEMFGTYIAKSGDNPLSLNFLRRRDIHRLMPDSVTSVDDVIKGLEKHFPGLSCLSLLCDWLSGPDFVFNELRVLRGRPFLDISCVIDEDEAVPLCRRLLSFHFRSDLRPSNVQSLIALQ